MTRKIYSTASDVMDALQNGKKLTNCDHEDPDTYRKLNTDNGEIVNEEGEAVTFDIAEEYTEYVMELSNVEAYEEILEGGVVRVGDKLIDAFCNDPVKSIRGAARILQVDHNRTTIFGEVLKISKEKCVDASNAEKTTVGCILGAVFGVEADEMIDVMLEANTEKTGP